MPSSGSETPLVKFRWTALVTLTSIVVTGTLFLLSNFIAMARSTTDLPILPLQVIVVVFHLMPLIGSRESINAFIAGKENKEAAIWSLVRTYIALDTVEIGLILVFKAR